MSATQDSLIEMLNALRAQVDMANDLMKGRDWLIEDRWNISGQLGDFRIGDFEIRCLNPEKYGLPPRQPGT